MSQIKLQSSDGREFTVDAKAAKMSETIKNMLEDLGGDGENAIPVPNVTGAILEKVISYCLHHKDDVPKVVEEDPSKPKKEEIDAWDAEFCKVDYVTLFNIILAANYLDIKPLLDVTCKTVANVIRGKTPDEIRKTLGVKSEAPASAASSSSSSAAEPATA
ncbi:skp1 [Capsaspora owczarzaki ATCC 30864]|uniref:Skp1 n=1 Tax=Capsaspora owczarzaki (strain ATCC 30864) TaxID=595528 RepID=A0A0D2WUS0_CAPO3|nr:skp1 [Capsaspora owczarzaki ATCC 30864]KJE95763.1 skp1 [Capsaspora owczarzaki ATCC 30864]|eukprot:XP_004345769.2 skp1 [Capsaspora owczarzaki ATCC 30864]